MAAAAFLLACILFQTVSILLILAAVAFIDWVGELSLPFRTMFALAIALYLAPAVWRLAGRR